MPAAGILGWKRSKYQRPILHNSKSPETPRKLFLEIIKILSGRNTSGGPPPVHEGGGAPPASWAPCWPSGAHLLLYEVFRPKKNHKQAFGTRLRRHEAEPWRNQSRAPAELFCRGHFPPGGGNHRHRHHQRSSHREGVNLHQHLHQHHLLSKPQFISCIQSCIKTTNWYLWVASSVDYSLQLMLIGLLGGRSYVQILNAYYYPSDYEHEYAL